MRKRRADDAELLTGAGVLVKRCVSPGGVCTYGNDVGFPKRTHVAMAIDSSQIETYPILSRGLL